MDRRALIGLAAMAATAATSARAGAPSKGAPAAEAYLPIQTLTATIVRPGGRRGVLTVEAALHTPDPALAGRAAQSVPRLRAAFNLVVSELGRGLLPGGVPDVDRLGRQLQAACDQVLGRAGARVLLGTVMAV
ncbi:MULTISPECIES: Tat pathway signal protein [Brevundimonas]|uniref:Tat pathway signal protein n=1 Tax=Brevundimonas TaxID=41275 RepID=UPI000F017BA4|nr:Tat pathway signal protein [Brevundimonas lutea]